MTLLRLLFRLLLNALAIAVVARLLPGIHVVNQSLGTYLLIALVFGIVNTLLKPILTFLTCPLVALTLGLFILVINGVMLLITSALLPDLLIIDGFWWAVLGGIIISLLNMIFESLVGGDNNTTTRVEVTRIDRR